MDCEKFETAMIDELYDELDELTSAAAKRHVAGCARCAALYSGLRATRRVMASAGGIPMVEVPSTLEDRILAATREAQKVVPFRRRFASAISAAGSWAMRPQTQMAAVFLLMIGGSVVFLKGGRNAASSRAPMTVTEQGAPAASIAALSKEESLDTPAANAAHGAKKSADPSPTPAASAVAMATATAAAPAGGGATALPADEANGFMDGLTRGQGRADKSGALGQLSADDAEEQKQKGGAYRPRAVATPPSNAGAIGGASNYGGLGGGGNGPATPPAARAPAKVALADNADPSAPSPAATAAPGPYASKPSAPPPPAAAAPATVAQTVAPGSGGDMGGVVAKDAKKEDRDQGASAFDSARAAYAQRKFPDALRQFDALAAGGDKTSALWAARSTRDGSGCSAALQRYDTIAGQQVGTNNGNDALLEGGQCYRQVGNVEAARARLVRLLTVASHAARAQRELDAMSPKAAAKPQPRKAPEPSQQQAPSKDNAF